MNLTIGRIVSYALNQADAENINRRRADWRSKVTDGDRPPHDGYQVHVGNYASAGEIYPAMVVRVFDPDSGTSNLQVFLDGNDTYWATSRREGSGEGFWTWPTR